LKKIILIIPYFGKLPIWFDAYLLSINMNPTINWLCVTDCEIPINHPKNIKFITKDLTNLNARVNNIVSANVPLTPRKFCDLKPAYGDIFSDEIKNYDFWGYCDMDIIWGDIRKFITDNILENYNIISSRKNAISGHFNLFKNNNELNKLYRKVPNYAMLFEQNRFMWFDEQVLTKYLSNLKTHNLSIMWSKILLNKEKGVDSHQEYYLDRWQWINGKIIDTYTKNEVMYLHFINWKKTMQRSEIEYKDKPLQFYISYDGIHYQTHTKIQLIFNDLKNIVNGYWINEKIRIRKLKMKNLIKRIKRKLT